MTATALPDLPSGIYQHYKGPLYLVLGYAHDANTDDDEQRGTHDGELVYPDGRTVVVYAGLELDGAHTGARLAVRTAADFWTLVCPNPDCDRFGTPPDGTGPRPDSCGLCQRRAHHRFAYVGPTWDGQR